MECRCTWLLAAALPLLVQVGAAWACTVPPFNDVHVLGGTVVWSEDAEGCGLDSTITLNSNFSAAAAHVARRDAELPLRLSFRVDLSALQGQNLIQSTSIVAGVAEEAVISGSASNADLFRLMVYGNVAGTTRLLGVSAACEDSPGLMCSASAPLTNDQPTIGLDWVPGIGGQLRVWIDTPFSDAPTVALPSSNAAWAGIQRLVLGLSSVSVPFAANQVNRTVRFDQIEVMDDQIAWTDFDPEGFACAGLPIFTSGTVSGTTCGGELSLPTLASGATRAAPSVVYSFTAPYEIASFTMSETGPAWGSSMFLCETPCGPTQRCIAAGNPSSPIATAGLVPGRDYRVIITATGVPMAACGGYSFGWTGPLGD